MASCADCQALSGRGSATPPHAHLRFVANELHRTEGMRNARCERYRCAVCATEMLRDMDKRSKAAAWEESGS